MRVLCHRYDNISGRQLSVLPQSATILPDPSPTDQDLVTAALRDRHAYALILRRWHPILSRYLRRLLGQSAEATDDVLQDVFIKVYLSLNGYDHARPFGPWIYRIARNEALNFLRKRKTEPPMVTGEEAQLIIQRLSDGVDLQETTEHLRIDEKVRSAINRLDLRYRDVLVLRFLEDKGYDEIAEIMRVPSGTVATLISRGTKQLRAALQEMGLNVRDGS
jgi:RNA polymerase sigma-70 factor, ECF subfamily